MSDRRLTLKQEKFVAAYIGQANGNATEAARLAGYRGNDVTLGAVGTENLHKPLIREAIEGYRAEIKAEGLASKQYRIDALDERHRRLNQIMHERAADPEMQAVSGGRTGLLVKSFKQVGQGSGAQLVEEYAVDTGLLREFRDHEKQAAQETGQWTEKADLDLSMVIEFAGVDPDRL